MARYRLMSSDDHIFEPRDMWTTRMEPRFRDRAPRIDSLPDGDWWVCDGIRGPDAGTGAQAGVRFEEPGKLSRHDRYENVRPGGYIPEEHVKDMDIDGVDVSIMYPTAGLSWYSVPDSELLTAICDTYNGWIAEFCQSYPDRLKGIAMVNVDDVQTGMRQLERVARMGLVGAMITVYPPEDRAYGSPEYELLWAAAQDLGIPLSLHIGTNRILSGPGAFDPSNASRAASCNVDYWVRMSIANMIYAGVFERYPKLQVGSIEMEVSWAPHFLDRLDYNYFQRAHWDTWYRFKEDMRPSDYFHRNVFVGFQEDTLGVELRHIIGVDNLLWGSDYPHIESTFPRSREILEQILSSCTEGEKAKIVGGNCARVYHLE